VHDPGKQDVRSLPPKDEDSAIKDSPQKIFSSRIGGHGVQNHKYPRLQAQLLVVLRSGYFEAIPICFSRTRPDKEGLRITLRQKFFKEEYREESQV
jgi:hypothetical protein